MNIGELELQDTDFHFPRLGRNQHVGHGNRQRDDGFITGGIDDFGLNSFRVNHKMGGVAGRITDKLVAAKGGPCQVI